MKRLVFIFYSLVFVYFKGIFGQSVTVSPSPQANITIGNTLEISCTAHGTVIILEWMQNGMSFASAFPGSCNNRTNRPNIYQVCTGNVFTLGILLPEHGSTWTCRCYLQVDAEPTPKEDSTTVYVLVPFDSVSFNPQSTLVVNVNEQIESVCTSSPPSRPGATVTWYMLSQSGPPVAIQITSPRGNNDPESTTSKLDYTTKLHDHGKTLYCQATAYGLKKITSRKTTVHVRYAPTGSPGITVRPDTKGYNDGTAVSLTCQVSSGRPLATLMWKCKNVDATSNAQRTDTSITAVSVLNLTIDSTYNGNSCICTAMQVVNYRHTVSKSFVVYYAPANSVQLSMTAIPHGNRYNDGHQIQLICSMNGGNPVAILTWACLGKDVISQSVIQSNGSISQSHLTLSMDPNYNGKWCTCKATHKFITSYEKSKDINFTVYFSAKFAFNIDKRKIGDINDNTTITVPFYSNPPVILKDIKWINISDGKILKDSPSLALDLVNTEMKKLYYGVEVSTNGQTATLSITNFQSYHAGNYTVEITNGKNLTSVYKFEIVTSSTPESPTNFAIYEKSEHSVTFIWLKGFDGGHIQTFIIIYKDIDAGKTKEKRIVDEKIELNYTYTVEGLNPSTTYHFWLYASNKNGNSSLSSSDALFETTENAKIWNDSRNSSVGAIIGSIVGVIVSALVVVAILLVYKRRKMTLNCNESKKDKHADSRDTVMSDKDYEDLKSEVENQTYEGLSSQAYENIGASTSERTETLEKRERQNANQVIALKGRLLEITNMVCNVILETGGSTELATLGTKNSACNHGNVKWQLKLYENAETTRSCSSEYEKLQKSQSINTYQEICFKDDHKSLEENVYSNTAINV